MIGSDCVLEARSATGATLGRLELADATAAHRLRRVLATPDLVFVLRGRPASLEVYELPSMNRIPVVGDLGLREPTDLAVSAKASEPPELYVVDNVRDSTAWSDADVFFDNELRLLVVEGRQRFAEYFTLDGVFLERQRLNGQP
jgi:hypothetical protein